MARETSIISALSLFFLPQCWHPLEVESYTLESLKPSIQSLQAIGQSVREDKRAQKQFAKEM